MLSSLSSSSSSFFFYQKIVQRLQSIQPRETVIYFEGYLDLERLTNPFGPASMCANIARDLAERGKITLLQKRMSPPYLKSGIVDWSAGRGDGFYYLAIGKESKK